MMGVGKCKDLDEWLMGSGETVETADGKPTSNQFGQKSKQNHLIQPKPAEEADDIDDVASEKDEEDWMFCTFDKGKANMRKQLDPFAKESQKLSQQEIFDEFGSQSYS